MNANQRQWDLIRQQRQELFQSDLITEEEYSELSQDHSAVKRLEDYDVIRAELATLKSDRDAADQLRSATECELATAHERINQLTHTNGEICRNAKLWQDEAEAANEKLESAEIEMEAQRALKESWENRFTADQRALPQMPVYRFAVLIGTFIQNPSCLRFMRGFVERRPHQQSTQSIRAGNLPWSNKMKIKDMPRVRVQKIVKRIILELWSDNDSGLTEIYRMDVDDIVKRAYMAGYRHGRKMKEK